MEYLLEAFNFAKWPKIYYGPGITKSIENTLADLDNVLWVTGGKEGYYSSYFKMFLTISGININSKNLVQISGEPSPQDIDAICQRFQDENNQTNINKVIGIGGGSVLDAAKALSAMLVTQHSLLDYLEGIGKGLTLPDNILPFVAIPTTSGTGSEMTSNAVFSQVGDQGYKKSIRHDKLIPTEIWLDSSLTTTCPPLQTACCGLDAFTQLLEAYLSTKSNLMTDMLAEKGMQLIIDNLDAACSHGAQNTKVRGALAIASMLSGSCLTNAGLGIVHGIAGPMGGFYDIPHGVACAGLIAKANQVTLDVMIRENNNKDITKMAKIGLLCSDHKTLTKEQYCQALVDKLYRWQKQFKIPKFAQYGLNHATLDQLISASSYRNNPVKLSDKEIRDIIQACI